MAFDPQDNSTPGAKIKVIGVGGGGTNAVSTMIRSNIEGVDFIAANTDVQSLRFALAPKKIQIGKELTKGLGAGADPDIGRDAALEDRHQLQEVIAGADMVFITAGMGGGTGTGGASVVSQIARESGALTVGVVTKPFNFEGKRRKKHAELGIARLREHVDTLIVIPNDRLLKIATPELTMLDAFKMADNVLVNAVRGISDIINVPGTINVDFADVKTVMSSMGQALMGIGTARGEKRAVEAARQAISSPLLEDIDIEGATGILINITAGEKISLLEIDEACSIIQDAAHDDANIIFGAVIDENMNEEIRVTVIATGFPSDADNEYPLPEKAAYNKQKNFYKPSRSGSSSFTSSFEQGREHKEDSFDQIINEGHKNHQKEEFYEKKESLPLHPSSPVASSAEPKAASEGQEKEPEDLTRWTMAAIENEPHVEDSIAKESPLFEPSISFEADKEGQEVPEVAPGSQPSREAPRAAAARNWSRPAEKSGANFQAEEDFDFAKSAASLDAGLSQEDSQKEQALPPFFLDAAGDGLNEEIDKKIDEALELAERVKRVNTDDDDLDVPAFLRNSAKDLPLS